MSSEATETATLDGDGETEGKAHQDVGERLAELEAELTALSERVDAQQKHVVKPRLDDLEARSDDARDERAELRATVQDLQTKVANLHYTVETLKGIGENEQTSPAARVRDLRSDMIESARTLTNRKGIQLWWREVQDRFATLGHGEVKAPECHKAMETAAEADGFDLTTKVNENGNEVKAIRLKSEALPAQEGVSNPTNAKGVGPDKNGGDRPQLSNDD